VTVDRERVVRTGLVAAEPAEALANLLGTDVPEGQLPPMWHWVQLLEHPPQAALGPDGHPTTGIPRPPGPGQRRMFAGGRVLTLAPLDIGAVATRTTWVANTVEKRGRSGPLTFVTVRNEYRQGERLAVVDEVDIVYRAPGAPLPLAPGSLQVTPWPAPREPALTLRADETLLFRFSALTYNAHRIHYDHGWARREGYGDLVVHGPLQALMMAELIRRRGDGLVGREFAYRLVAPMVGPQTLTVVAAQDGLDAGVEVHDVHGTLTAVGSAGTVDLS
jgi:3-methylfumaryl-CoA hydratase